MLNGLKGKFEKSGGVSGCCLSLFIFKDYLFFLYLTSVTSASERNHRSVMVPSRTCSILLLLHCCPSFTCFKDTLTQNEVIFPPGVSEHQISHNSHRPRAHRRMCQYMFYRYLIHIECDLKMVKCFQ